MFSHDTICYPETAAFVKFPTTKMRSSISSFFSSVFPVVHADSEEKHEEVKQDAAEEVDSEAAPVEEPEEPEDVS